MRFCVRCGLVHQGDAGDWQCYRLEAQRAWEQVVQLNKQIEELKENKQKESNN